MHSLTTMITAFMAFNSAFASPAPTITTTYCATPSTTTTTTPLRFGVCPVCIAPTSSCSAGEPTGPTPRPPTTTTLDAASGACTATVEVFNNPGCGNCATCTSAAPGVTGRGWRGRRGQENGKAVRAPQAGESTTTLGTLPGGDFCSPTATVVTTVKPPPTEVCACAAVLSTCSYGQPTVPPMPTTTLMKGCVEEVVVGPGNCFNLCPTCAY